MQLALSLDISLPPSIWKVLEDLCSSPAPTPAIHHAASLTADSALPARPAYPSVGVLGRFIVVPEAQASNALGSVKVDHNHMVQPRGKGDQPHVLILGGDVHAIDQPAGKEGRSARVGASGSLPPSASYVLEGGRAVKPSNA